jgi:selenocysteine-specific elongation factor
MMEIGEALLTVYDDPMRHVVWGTAGHIDHGKTSLIKALTGTDCDRLPEERERGITIDLGFAQLSDDDLQLHFVDVPGHERLVHTMIAGASGIDLALLVIAADEGVMPQTREHLEVIRLMGVPGGAVALTKVDLVDDELAELVTEEVRDFLAPTTFAEVPVVPVSTKAGTGIAELRSALLARAQMVRPRQIEGRPFREPVDRVFSLTGAGTVITGTSQWGVLEVGSEVTIYPHGAGARVRRLHVHGAERQKVEAGERVAINLVGLAREALARGDQVLTPGPWSPTRLVTVHLELLASAPGPLDEGDEVEVHALAARVSARIDRLAVRPLSPGARAVAQISLREAMLLFPDDRLVLRRPSPVNTFAGGKVLDAGLRRWRRRDSAELDQLPDVRNSDWPQLLASWIEREGLAGLSLPAISGRLGVFDPTVEAPIGRLLEDGNVKALATHPPSFVASSVLDGLARDAVGELQRRFAGEDVSAGIPARDFAGKLLPRSALALADVYLEELRDRGVLELSEGRVVPPGSDDHMTRAGKELARKVEALYREDGFDASSPADAARRLQVKPAAIESICRYLLQRRRLVRLDGKYLIHRAVLDEMAQRVYDWDVDDFGVGEFKERFGLTRKLGIPALEWLDSERVTVRHGNRRKIIRRKR